MQINRYKAGVVGTAIASLLLSGTTAANAAEEQPIDPIAVIESAAPEVLDNVAGADEAAGVDVPADASDGIRFETPDGEVVSISIAYNANWIYNSGKCSRLLIGPGVIGSVAYKDSYCR